MKIDNNDLKYLEEKNLTWEKIEKRLGKLKIVPEMSCLHGYYDLKSGGSVFLYFDGEVCMMAQIITPKTEGKAITVDCTGTYQEYL